MSDAPAAQVSQNGVPPVSQDPTPEPPSFKVFAGNLAYTTTDDGLKAFFAPVAGDIVSVQIIHRGTRSAGYGFVALRSAEAVQQAVDALNKKELDGRELIIEAAKPSDQKDQEKKEKKPKRRPGRRGAKAVPGEVTEAEANGDAPKAEDAAAPEASEAAKPKKKKKKTSRRSKKPAAPAEGAEGTAALADAPAADATADGAAETTEAGAKKPRVRKPRAPRLPRPVGEAPVGEPSKTMLFVANLGFTVDDEGLAALFKEADIAVTSARIVRRRWGQPRKSKGYGFVEVADEQEQQKAITALDGKDIGGRPIAVKVAVNTPQEEEAKADAPAVDAAPAAAATPAA